MERFMGLRVVNQEDDDFHTLITGRGCSACHMPRGVVLFRGSLKRRTHLLPILIFKDLIN